MPIKHSKESDADFVEVLRALSRTGHLPLQERVNTCNKLMYEYLRKHGDPEKQQELDILMANVSKKH